MMITEFSMDIVNLISEQTNLEVLFAVYFLITVILVIISKINNYNNKRKNSYIKKHGINSKVRKVIKFLLLMNLMGIFIIGCLITRFINNLLVYTTVLLTIYYLAEAVFIENGTITKIFNAEVKYDTIAENTNYLECILNKNELNVTMVAVTNEFIKSKVPLITNIEEAYETLYLIAKEYIDKFDLSMKKIVVISSPEAIQSGIEDYLNEISVYSGDKELLDIVDDMQQGNIRQINETTFIVPIKGLKYQGIIALRGKEIDSIDASIIKNIGILLF